MLPLLLLLQTTAPAQLTEFLQRSIGFDTQQLATVERGEPVVKVLETQDRRDVALFGIITTPVRREQYVRALRDFPTSPRTPNRTQLGIFSNPATESDVAAVKINSRDAGDMKNCKPGDCVAKLPATDMRRIHEQVNWSAPPPRSSSAAERLRATPSGRVRHRLPPARRLGDGDLRRSRQPQRALE